MKRARYLQVPHMLAHKRDFAFLRINPDVYQKQSVLRSVFVTHAETAQHVSRGLSALASYTCFLLQSDVL